MVPQHSLAIRFVLHKACCTKEIGGFEPSRKATDPRKKIKSSQHLRQQADDNANQRRQCEIFQKSHPTPLNNLAAGRKALQS